MMGSPHSPIFSTPQRHSLNSSPGPRPIHLVDGHPHPPSPPPTEIRAFHSKSRRQSSISYYPRDRNPGRDATLRSPPSSNTNSLRHGPTRSNSLGRAPATPLQPKEGESEGDAQPPPKRPPLTPAEKHYELLHFIARKEAKCLELRSQLALHEAELLQLKRKWERIVSRGFEKKNNVDITAAPSTTHAQGGGTMLDGIREGVQEVGRFFAAMGEPPGPQRMHAVNHSSSSVSTCATKSTHLSPSSSSATSFSGEDAPAHVLMVHDTGATPTMSPNPEYVHQQQQQARQPQEHKQQQYQEQRGEDVRGATLRVGDAVSSDVEHGAYSTRRAAQMHRRKSREYQTLLDDVLGLTVPAFPPANEAAKPEQQELPAPHATRVSVSRSVFPPVSSIPGLGSLTVGAAASPVSSWVGSVGKRFGELQRESTFSKNRKRASLLLSDVSQSVVSALSSPSPATSATASYFSPGSPVPAATTTVPSLLDSDEGPAGLASHSVLTPDPGRSPVIRATSPATGGQSTSLPQGQTGDQEQENDDEWNW